MRMDQLTVKAAEAVQAAHERASSAGHTQLEPLHLLLSLIESDQGNGGIVVPIIDKVGAQADRLREIAERELARRPRASGGQTVASREFQEVLQGAQKQADSLKDKYVSTEHLLLALATVKSEAKEVLSLGGVTPESILAAMKEFRGNQRVDTQNPEDTYQSLQRYGRDLVELARRGKIDPVIGRGADPADEEQSGADRRAGRGQDGDRRRVGVADRQRRCAGGAEEQASGGS